MQHSRDSVDFSLPLWSFAFNVDRLRIVVVIIGGIQLLLRDGAHLELTVFGIWIAFLVASGFWARFQFLRDPRSLRRIFRLFQFGGWPLGLVLASFGWHIVLLTDAQAANMQYVFATVAGALAAYLGFTYYYATRWRAGLSMYQEWAQCTSAGSISANQLLGILSYSGRSTRMNAVIPAIAGIGMVGTIVASQAFEPTAQKAPETYIAQSGNTWLVAFGQQLPQERGEELLRE